MYLVSLAARCSCTPGAETRKSDKRVALHRTFRARTDIGRTPVRRGHASPAALHLVFSRIQQCH